MGVGNPVHRPSVQALMREVELRPNEPRAEGLDEATMGMFGLGHASPYQISFDSSSAFDFIALQNVMAHIRRVSFSDRLTAAWKAAGFRSERQAALACDVSPQRFNSWTKGARPDPVTLAKVARVLKTTPSALLSEGTDEGLRDILLHLFALEGMTSDRADTLASAVLEAKRLLEVFPEDAPLHTRASHAAHAAWQQQQPQARGT